MKSILIAAALVLFTACGKSTNDIRSKVMKLTGPRGLCSGEQVRGKSGTNYVLTAAHCAGLAVDGAITVTTADGRQLQRRIVAEDTNADLLLLEGVPNMQGLDVAKKSQLQDAVRTFTHGNRFETYETAGVLIDYAEAAVPVEDSFCDTGFSKYQKRTVSSFFGTQEELCVMYTIDLVTNALIVPGSSGGPIVNKDGDLVGVVSAGDGTFGYMVKTADIRNFLRSY